MLYEKLVHIVNTFNKYFFNYSGYFNSFQANARKPNMNYYVNAEKCVFDKCIDIKHTCILIDLSVSPLS